jgi:hypothetical protein
VIININVLKNGKSFTYIELSCNDVWKICKNVKNVLQNTLGITQEDNVKRKFMSSLCKSLKNVTLDLICKIILFKCSTYIYNRVTNANINYLKSKSHGKCVKCVNFSHMQIFFSQVSNISNTFNVLLTPCVSNIMVHFD